VPDLQLIEHELLTDPRFATLSYQDQMYVRMNRYVSVLKDDEKFQQLTPQDKAYVLESLTTQAPALQDKNAEMFARKLYQEYKAAPEARSTLTSKAPADRMLDFTNQYRMDTHSLIAGFLDRRLIYPLLERFGVAPSSTRVMTSPEVGKVVDFFDTVLSKDKRYAKISGAMASIVPIVAELGETIGLFALTGIGGISGAVGKAASTAAKTRTLAALGTAAGWVTEELVEGLMIWGQHTALDLLNRGAQDNPALKEVFWNNRKYFYEGMLIGIGLNAAI